MECSWNKRRAWPSDERVRQATTALLEQVRAENTPEAQATRRSQERQLQMRRKREYARNCAIREAELMSHMVGQDVGLLWDGKFHHVSPDTVEDSAAPNSNPCYGG